MGEEKLSANVVLLVIGKDLMKTGQNAHEYLS